MFHHPPPVLRQEALREAWPTTVDQLQRRRGDAIAPGFIDDYLALRWLECRSGELRVTGDGEAMRRQVDGRRPREPGRP